MGRKLKYPFDTKLNVVLRYLAGEASIETESSTNQSYSAELKMMAVSNYVAGKGSLNSICKKYGIRSTRQLRSWIMKYMSELERLRAENRDDSARGYRRLRDDLERDYDISVNDKRILRLCRELNIKSTIKYANIGCTRQAKNPLHIAENI